MELRIAQSALEDLQAIQEYYREQDVPHIGDDFVAAILEHCGMLKIHPDAGRAVPEFNLDHIRELIHAPFRVVYLRQSKEVVLIRVWRSERLLELPENETGHSCCS
ncbi:MULTISPECIES: type II toxin-antitoxin system RelE/ParE family toxin [Halomonas]|uniref:type II toxin-antitoxin system RelE/ParE family toxin n=1 Tax=Halomonas TaxID=2745 RepID=UPI00105E2458|nr:type II toxin-antitoxin system RelE/ParE family toxin [Halomonas ventosae]